jgi:hypothetical protein
MQILSCLLVGNIIPCMSVFAKISLGTALASTILEVATRHTNKASLHRLSIPPRPQNAALSAASAAKEKRAVQTDKTDTIDIQVSIYVYPINKNWAPKKVCYLYDIPTMLLTSNLTRGTNPFI